MKNKGYHFFLYFQVVNAPKNVDTLLKSRICEKKVLPYGKQENGYFYDPACIDGMYECKNICGTKCKQKCKNLNHSPDCGRGRLPQDFLSCPSKAVSQGVLEYISYGLVEDKFLKEGKKPYKKMEQIKVDKQYLYEIQ